MGHLEIEIDNYRELRTQIDRMKRAPQKVIDRTLRDFKMRAPSWIAQEVVKEYNIKKSEIVPKSGRKGAGSARISGSSIETMSIVYKGRVLTPVHFGMTPKIPKQSYTLAAQVIKGQKKTWGKVKKLTKKQRTNIGRNFTGQSTKASHKSPIMLMSTGNKHEGGVDYIPFQRQSGKRNDLKTIKTLSLPQMVSNQKVETNIKDAVTDKLGKRFEHYVKLYLEED